MLSETDRARVRESVKKAEATLAAEIVPCVFAQSRPLPGDDLGRRRVRGRSACGALFMTDVVHPLWLPLSTLILFVPAAGFVGAILGHRCARSSAC